MTIGFSGINVAAAHQNFGDSKHPTPAISSCAALDWDGQTFKTNCSAGAWASGSGLLCDSESSGTPSLAGILVSTVIDPLYDFKGYDSQNNYTRVIPISDAIIEKIDGF
jgi:hypothetical protein